LSLQETEFTTREEEVRHHEQGLRLQEKQLSTLEDRLNRERESLESRENMASQTAKKRCSNESPPSRSGWTTC
jgi:hypothetical protein